MSVLRLTPAQAVEVVGGKRLSTVDVEAHVMRYITRLERDKLGARGFVNGMAEARIVGLALVSAGVVRDYAVWSTRLGWWDTIREAAQ